MGEKTDRDIRSLRERMNGSFWPALLAVLGVGGVGTGSWAAFRPSENINKELIEYRLTEMESRLSRIEVLLEARLPAAVR